MTDRIIIPEYPIPKELENVLDKNLNYSNTSGTSRKYEKILETLKEIKCLDISENHYLQLLKLALYLEEYQSNQNMKKYELFKKTIKKINNPELDPKLALFHITVKELDEERPWVKANDFVDVIDIKEKKLYTLQVTNVTQTDIVANDDVGRLRDSHKPEKLYDIKFRFQNWPLRCAHYALGLISRKSIVKYLFPQPNKSYIEKDGHEHSASKFEAVNPNIANNTEQNQAVLNILNKSSFPAPYILYGPPGTGKTATLVEALCQIHNRNDYSHVLVCTPSNTAGDEITRRLLQYLPPDSIYRMYSQSKDGSTIEEQIRLCSNVEKKTIVQPRYEEVISKRILITTLCTATRLIIMKVPSDHFSHLFIDEAGQDTEPNILIPISLVSGGGRLYSQIVFAGDPQQLGPTVISKLADNILGRSILERLMSYDTYQKGSDDKYNPEYITKLLQNYRSHPDIIGVSNELFYENELIAKCVKSSGKENLFLYPVIFHGIEGREEKCSYSPSVSNWFEVRQVLHYVDDLLKNRLGFGAVTANDIGIVTPFTLQSQKIKKALKNKNLKDINVGTVELFQGQEKKIIIMTTVRNKTFIHEGKEHIGFLSNAKRFNVAITRAKDLLVVVGNPNVLQIDKNWRYLLKFCIDNQSYRGVPFSLITLSDKKDHVSSKLIKSADVFERLSLPLCTYELELSDLMDDLDIFD